MLSILDLRRDPDPANNVAYQFGGIPMLIIRKEQMDVLRDAALRRYKNTLYAKMLELRKAHAEAFPLISDADLAHRISDFVDDARSLGLKSQRDIALFVSLRLLCEEVYLDHAQRWREELRTFTNPQTRSDYLHEIFNYAIAVEGKRDV